ncbi:MAG TPA: VOC family protein [Candidatus Eremiobacteraceae bacterium]|nr:VOC family protein [Candidatus Eremiobacteraceae bacterium]
MQLQPYLFFSGNCEEALEFYKSVFGGKIVGLSRFKDMPPSEHGEARDGVMHATFESPSFTFMASDGRPNTVYGEGRVSLSLGYDDAAQAERIFKALGQGGKVDLPFSDAFWGAKFGMLTDRFGIDWMVSAPLGKA